MDDAIASRWFYDDHVLSEENLVRAEKRAVVRRLRQSGQRRRRHHGARANDEEAGEGLEARTRVEEGARGKGDRAEGGGVSSGGAEHPFGDGLLFWDWEGPAAKARGSTPPPSCSQTYEVDAGTLEMIQECLRGYQQNTEVSRS